MQPAGLGEDLPGLSTGEKKLGAPALEKFVSIPYTSDENDSGDEFWLALFTVFYFVAKQGACIVFVFVFVF